jgi:hypothetical protein
MKNYRNYRKIKSRIDKIICLELHYERNSIAWKHFCHSNESDETNYTHTELRTL